MPSHGQGPPLGMLHQDLGRQQQLEFQDQAGSDAAAAAVSVGPVVVAALEGQPLQPLESHQSSWEGCQNMLLAWLRVPAWIAAAAAGWKEDQWASGL